MSLKLKPTSSHVTDVDTFVAKHVVRGCGITLAENGALCAPTYSMAWHEKKCQEHPKTPRFGGLPQREETVDVGCAYSSTLAADSMRPCRVAERLPTLTRLTRLRGARIHAADLRPGADQWRGPKRWLQEALSSKACRTKRRFTWRLLVGAVGRRFGFQELRRGGGQGA